MGSADMGGADRHCFLLIPVGGLQSHVLVVWTKTMEAMTEALDVVGAAIVPSDLFGPITHDPAAQRAARRRFHRLSVLIHPDRVDPAYAARAAAAFTHASNLYRRWQHDATTTTSTTATATATAIVLDGNRGSYRLGPRHARGSIADLHHAADSGGAGVVIKVPRNVSSNALIDAEWAALTEIAASAEGGNDWLRAYFPQLIDHLTHADPVTGARRQVNVLDSLTTGFVTLAEVSGLRTRTGSIRGIGCGCTGVYCGLLPPRIAPVGCTPR
nr:hypothetical protein [Rhodococcus sp. JVH1]